MASTITAEQQEILDAMASEDAAAAYTTQEIEAFIAAVNAGERATVHAAKATYVAATKGNLWVGKSTEMPAGKIGVTVFGERFKTVKKPDGYSKAAVTGWYVAGRAFAEHGIEPDSRLGKDLVGSYGQYTDIRAEVEKNHTTRSVKNIQAAVDRKKAQQKAAKEAADKRRADKEAAEPVKMPTTGDDKAAFTVVTQALAAIGDAAKAKAVLDSVVEWFEKEGTAAIEAVLEAKAKADAEAAEAEQGEGDETPAA